MRDQEPAMEREEGDEPNERDEPNAQMEEDEPGGDVDMDDEAPEGGWDRALDRLAQHMPKDLQLEVNDLLHLYARNGVPDARASRAVHELYSPPRVTKELKQMRRRVPGMRLVPGATFGLLGLLHAQG